MSPETSIAAASALGTFFLAVIFYRGHWLWSLSCAALFIVSIGAVIYFLNEQEYEERGNDAIYMGILEPGAKYPLIPTSCTTRIPSDAAVLALGRASGAILDSQPQMVAFTVGRS